MFINMMFGTNGCGGYYLGRWNLYATYSEADKNGNSVDGYCWCVKSDLDNEEIDFVAETMEECVEWIFEQEDKL